MHAHPCELMGGRGCFGCKQGKVGLPGTSMGSHAVEKKTQLMETLVVLVVVVMVVPVVVDGGGGGGGGVSSRSASQADSQGRSGGCWETLRRR